MNGSRRALVTGADGQLGVAIRHAAPAAWQVVGLGKRALDVTQRDRVREMIQRERPTLIVHAAAYTAVDAAEREPAVAEAVNVGGTAHVADAAHEVGARLVYISTDYVFDGASGRPYRPSDPVSPLNVYGRTKLAGEREVARRTAGAALILRTAWLYGAGGRNFVSTMLRLMRERSEIAVVSDQVGTPTWTRSLARAVWAAAERPDLRGVHQWTDAGVASWYDLAVAIQEEGVARGLLGHAVPISPIRSDERPAAAARPPFSVMDCEATRTALGSVPPQWRVHLRLALDEVAAA